jgi:glycerol kinase
MTASDWTMQRLADMLGAPVDRPKILETTALGAAYLAGWRAGVYGGPEAFAKKWRRQKRFVPAMGDQARAAAYAVWKDAVRRTLGPLGGK